MDVRFGLILEDRTGRDTNNIRKVGTTYVKTKCGYCSRIDTTRNTYILVLTEGYYASPKRIVAFEALKQQKGMKKGFSLNMSEVDHKATLWVRDLSQVIISPLLKSLLGFDKLDFSPGNHKAPYVSGFHQGYHSLYLYCPLIEPRMVGDAQVPLLRILLVAGRDGEMMTRLPPYSTAP